MSKKPNFALASSKANEARALLDQSRPPFDPEKVAEHLGIEVIYADFGEPFSSEICGFYRKRDNKIVVNKAIPANRMTFTIAHELGHARLHSEYIKSTDYQPVFRRNGFVRDRPKEEFEADAFAADFLVPLSALKRYKEIADVQELATLFAVSEEVIERRLDLLSRHPSLA